MNTEKALDMIDEYLLEPNNINKEWVEVLTMFKKVFVENAQLKKEIEKFEKNELFGTNTIERQNALIFARRYICPNCQYMNTYNV